MQIDFDLYLEKLRLGEYHFYDIPSEMCIFPFSNNEIDMRVINKYLNTFGQFHNHKENFQERKAICEQDKDWKEFVSTLKKEKNFTCEISGFTFQDTKTLSYELFGVKTNQTWINNWVVPHHIDGNTEYRCFDKDKLQILNRAIHLTKHRYDKLAVYLPQLKYDYKLWFELGCLIHDREGQYPWRNITDYKKET